MNYYFYELSVRPVDAVLPRIIQKIYDNGEKILIYAQNQDFLNQLNSKLWTFNKEEFLPHATTFDPTMVPSEQPILLTDTFANANHAQTLVIFEPPPDDKHLDFQKCYVIFEQQAPAVNEIHAWKSRLVAQKENILFWKETKNGTWTEEKIIN